jgi:hypothetical protein
VSTHKVAARGAGQRVSERKRSSEQHGIQREVCRGRSLPSRTVIERKQNAHVHAHTVKTRQPW